MCAEVKIPAFTKSRCQLDAKDVEDIMLCAVTYVGRNSTVSTVTRGQLENQRLSKAPPPLIHKIAPFSIRQTKERDLHRGPLTFISIMTIKTIYTKKYMDINVALSYACVNINYLRNVG